MLWGYHHCAAIALPSSRLCIFQQNKVDVTILWPQYFNRHVKVLCLAQLRYCLREGDTHICVLIGTGRHQHCCMAVLPCLALKIERKIHMFSPKSICSYLITSEQKRRGDWLDTRNRTGHNLFAFTDSIRDWQNPLATNQSFTTIKLITALVLQHHGA